MDQPQQPIMVQQQTQPQQHVVQPEQARPQPPQKEVIMLKEAGMEPIVHTGPIAFMWVDYTIVGVILLSAVISLWRGFAREAISLVAWIAAVWVSLVYSSDLSQALAPHIALDSARSFVSYLTLFVATLIVGGLLNYLISHVINKGGLSVTDRFFGIFFGGARGIVLVAVVVLLCGLTALPNDPWWKESMLLPNFELLALWMREHLPDAMKNYFVFPGH